MVVIVLLSLTAITWLYWLVAWWMVRHHFRSPRQVDPDFTPPVSILKPARGLDPQAYFNFASFCQQDYPDYELLICVSDPQDPALPVVERLQHDFPERSIRPIIGPVFGSNRKACALHYLASQARHDLLVISDSDMRVTADYLRRVVAPLADEKVGLVTCPYRGDSPRTLPSRLEALHMGVTFLPSVVVASRLLKLSFAMGSTVVLRRQDLVRLGGFRPIADHLADDYQIGARIGELGLRVHLSDYVTASVLGSSTLRELWHREVRWSRCARVSRPLEYPGLLLTFSTPLALLLLLLSGFAPLGWLALAVSLLLRWLVAWSVTAYTGNHEARRWLIWLPVRDLLSIVTWCVGGLGRHIVWRGERFVLQADGRMQPLPSGGRDWLAVLRAWWL